MKINTSSQLSVKFTANKVAAKGTLSFTGDGLYFRPNQITAKTPEIRIDYLDLNDIYVDTMFLIPFSVLLGDKKGNKYSISTIRARGIRKFLDNKF